MNDKDPQYNLGGRPTANQLAEFMITHDQSKVDPAIEERLVAEIPAGYVPLNGVPERRILERQYPHSPSTLEHLLEEHPNLRLIRSEDGSGYLVLVPEMSDSGEGPLDSKAKLGSAVLDISEE